jgi:hypothetical protein
MEPTSLQPGQKLIIQIPNNRNSDIAHFIHRYPAEEDCNASNLFSVPRFAYISQNDSGLCMLNDDEVSQFAQRTTDYHRPSISFQTG